MMSTPSEQLTLVKEGVQSNRFIVRETPLHVVRLRIIDHELEVRFELKPVLVLPLLQLRVHRAQIHRRLDDVEVAMDRSATRAW